MRLLTLFLFTIFLAFSCGGDDEPETPQEPTAVFIESIRVDRWPSTQANGGTWDSGLSIAPDIYFNVTNVTLSETVFTFPVASRIENPTAGTILNFNNLSVRLDSPGLNNYAINLFDYDDFSDDDFMGGIQARFYEESRGTPTTLTLDFGSEVAFTVGLRYQF